MAPTPLRSRSRAGAVVATGGFVAVASVGMGLALVSLLLAPAGSGSGCGSGAPAGVAVAPSAGGERVGATEYGGPGDPASGTIGSSGADLVSHPDSYAELGGATFQTATALGGLPYQTPLRVSWGGRSAIAYKRDIGLGGGPIDGRARAIDLWWQFAAALRIPYEGGRWSGTVRIAAVPAQGAGEVLGQVPAPASPPGAGSPATASPVGGGCPADAGQPGSAGTPTVAGPRARLLGDGRAAAPAGAPAAVQAMIAAGNQIVGKPYVYGAAHGLPLDRIAPAYDCSSSVEHLLWGGGLLPVSYGAASGALESFGAPGPGRWVTIYASADHVFMYVAGLRWDTHDAVGPGDGSTGIGWHPLIRSAAGFVARHPEGL